MRAARDSAKAQRERKDTAVVRRRHQRWHRVWSQLRRGEKAGLLAGFLILTIMVIGSLISPFILKYDPFDANVRDILVPPGRSHLLGTDEVGFDVLARVLYAPRVDLLIAFVATLVAVLCGVPLGLWAGMFDGYPGLRGVSSFGLMRAMDVVQSFPVFILALALVAGAGRSVTNVIIALVLVNIPIFARLTRAEVLATRERAHVDAAFLVGCSRRRIAIRHILPLSLGSVLTQFSTTAGFAILLTAGLSFVGAGVRPPTPEWGLMISSGAPEMIYGAWWPAVFPGLFLGVAVFALAVVGEAIRRGLSVHA